MRGAQVAPSLGALDRVGRHVVHPPSPESSQLGADLQRLPRLRSGRVPPNVAFRLSRPRRRARTVNPNNLSPAEEARRTALPAKIESLKKSISLEGANEARNVTAQKDRTG